MKKTRTILLQILVSLLPAIYLLSLWGKLPDTVPLHYGADFQADNFGSKSDMLGTIMIMFVVTIGAALLITNLDKIDPKRRFAANSALTVKISWAAVIFVSAISCFMVYQAEQYTMGTAGNLSPKYIVALIALLFVVLGNFMNNIKPNYFVGIRTPWTLDDEENWRLTHRLGSKIWFFGGLVLFVLVLVLPEAYVDTVMTISIIPFAGIPIFYSFYLFRQKQKKG